MILVKSIIAKPGKRPGLSEKRVRTYFIKKGCRVWRGMFLCFFNSTDTCYYKWNYGLYDELCQKFVDQIGVQQFKRLCVYCRRNKGAPDYIIWDGRKLFFVEVKLENEQVSDRQLKTMHYLSQFLSCCIYRVFSATRQSVRSIDVAQYLKDAEKGEVRLSDYIKKLEYSPVLVKKWQKA
ncbi:MAG: VRR-NUC domain-containing protein [Nanoarchaeota archaeon]